VAAFEVVEVVAVNIKKKNFSLFLCLLFAIFCMAVIIIVVVFSIRSIHKINNMKQKNTIRKKECYVFVQFNVEWVSITQ
jgi:hypothetical protein